MNGSLSAIDKQLGGTPLEARDAATFEEASAAFQAQFDPSGQDTRDRLKEIVRLLEVTDQNLGEVKNQKWFQRAWNTVSGKNQRLAVLNQQNLLRIQKGAFFFLEGLAAQNKVLMQTVCSALQRVEDNQIQNEKLKGHLILCVQKYNDRIRGIESRQDDLEHRLSIHEDVAKRTSSGPTVVFFLTGLVFSSAGVAVWAFDPGALGLTSLSIGQTSLAVGLSSFGAISFGATVYAFVRSRWGGAASGALIVRNGREKELEAIQKENAKIRARLTCETSDKLTTSYSLYCASELAKPFLQAFEALDAAFIFNDGEPSAGQVADAMDAYLGVSADFPAEVLSWSQHVAKTVCQDFDEIVGKITDGRALTALAFETERSQLKTLAHELVAAFAVYDEAASNIETLRASLLAQNARWRKLKTEGLLQSIGKGLVKGLLIIPLFLDDEDKFMKQFGVEVSNLESAWNAFRAMLAASIDSRVESVVRPWVSELVRRLDSLFDLCDQTGIRLTDIESILARHFSGGDD